MQLSRVDAIIVLVESYLTSRRFILCIHIIITIRV